MTTPTRRQVSQALNKAEVAKLRRKGSYNVISASMSFKAARQLFRLVKIARVLTEFKVENAIDLAVEAERREPQMINGVLWALSQEK